MTQYALPGDKKYQEQLYPNPDFLNESTGLKTYGEVIAHFTASSLAEDGIEIEPDSLSVAESSRGYKIRFEPLPKFATEADHFKKMHVAMLDERHAGLALRGVQECRKTPAWNPMKGYRVNRNPTDEPSEWLLYLPLGMPIANHRAVTLLHYPPMSAYRQADYLKATTLRRWSQLLKCCVPTSRPELYHLIIDVNPIAAPGSGESEYPNDYFPINLTSLFFDNDKEGLTYVRSMLALMLDPPHNEANPYTLPLIVGGSPEYDPQAPGWFRTRFKDHLPKDDYGIPRADVLQAGLIKIWPDSEKETPFIIANHMIAAGVKGRCTDDQSRIPDIQKYEAQDLVAATFLTKYAEHKKIRPDKAAREACLRWFGAPDGSGAPNPPAAEDRLVICALAQMDRCFEPKETGPKYTYQEAIARCQLKGGPHFSPCFDCDPLDAGSGLRWEDTATGVQPARGDYLICRSTEEDAYSVWRVDIDSDQLRFSRMPGQTEAKFDHTHQLISIGNYILEWGPLTLEGYSSKGVFPYRLFKFDPSNRNPLGIEAVSTAATEAVKPEGVKAMNPKDVKAVNPGGVKAVQKGFWEKKKFWGGRPDFGNPEGAAKAFDQGIKLMLVPLGTFVLNIIPTTGRGTFKLFNFDPGSTDPLTPFPSMILGSFETIQFGHELIPLGNFVLDRVVDPKAPANEKGKYWLWSFDPMDAAPLARPAIQTGRWHDIDENHQLIPIGEHVLDWDMKDNTYRLWLFDPTSDNPLTRPKGKPLRSGEMPEAFHAEMTLEEGIKGSILTSIQGLRPINQAFADKPGSIDFMRTKIKHVVYYMLENCSFDHVCGWLYEKGEEGINFVPPVPPDSDLAPFKGAKHAQSLGRDYNIDLDEPYAEHFVGDTDETEVVTNIENTSVLTVGRTVMGSGIAAGSTIVSIDSPTQITLSQATTATASGVSLTQNTPKKVHLEKFNYKGGKLSFLPTDPYHDMTDTMRQVFFHDWSGYAERKKPNMGGFVWNNGIKEVMWTYTPEQLPVLNGLAKAFAVSDEWFCSMPGATDSQRAFALTGSSLGQLDNFMNGPQYAHWPDNPHRPSIWKVLWANGFTDWKIYNSVKWPKPPEIPFVLTYHLFLEAQVASVDAKPEKYIANMDQFKEDAQTGNLPTFSFLEPVWILSDKPATSYHPSAEDGKGPGEIALNEIYEALKTGPKWNETLLIITFDEHGGLFDHVPPSYAHNPWPNDENDGFKYDLMGVRVPTILVSPWIKEQTVFRSPAEIAYDSTSILATLLSWYGIPKARWGLGERTHHAPTFEGVFQCESPRNDAPELPSPPSGEVRGERTERVRTMHQEMAWRMINYAASRVGNKRTHEAGRIADETLTKATDVDDLWKRMNDLIKQFSR